MVCLFIYLFMAALDPRRCTRALSSCGERGPLFVAARRPLTEVAPPAAEHGLQARASVAAARGLQSAGSAAAAHGPSCSAARGIPPDQGSSPCPPHWQADSQPLRHHGSPKKFKNNNTVLKMYSSEKY